MGLKADEALVHPPLVIPPFDEVQSALLRADRVVLKKKGGARPLECGEKLKLEPST